MNHSIKQIDAARLQANKMVRDQLMSGSFPGIHMISYDHVFKRSSRSLFESDGQGLSRKGVDRFLTVLFVALEEFMRNPEQRVSPNSVEHT